MHVFLCLLVHLCAGMSIHFMVHISVHVFPCILVHEQSDLSRRLTFSHFGKGTAGLFTLSNFMHTQLIFPVKQCQFETSILPVILFSKYIVIISMNLLRYFRLLVLGLCIF